MENKQYVEEDTIDLLELWRTLVKRKLLVVGLTLLFTLGTVLYSFTAKPIYEGKVLIEIGEVMITDGGEKVSIIKLNEPEDLKEIITTLHKEVSATVPKGSTSILELTYQGPDRKIITKTIQSAVDNVLKRHEKKAQWYKDAGVNVHMSQLVGEITISKNPVKPKRALIIAVAFITGLMFTVFLAFFLEFIKNLREESSK